MPTLTRAAAGRLIGNVIQKLRKELHVGRQWRKIAWDEIYEALCNEAPLVTDGGPFAALVFMGYAALAVEYLGDRPDQKRARDLCYLIEKTMGGSKRATERTSWLNLEEIQMIYDAECGCAELVRHIKTSCPVSV
ncbi:MAG: hypothetical protein WC050_01505 [Candidatus Paceibacterota bacterium]